MRSIIAKNITMAGRWLRTSSASASPWSFHTLALSTLTYLAIEKPMMRFGARVAFTTVVAHPQQAQG
jgi:hypothetical protein